MMKVKDGQCRVAVVQAEPVMFDKKACLSKALSLLQKAAKGGANLVVFPELFIPGYPYGMNFGFSVDVVRLMAGRTGSVIRMHPLLWVRKRRKC